MIQQTKTNDVLGTVNRGEPAESGLCTLCRADCTGRCETWLSSMAGRTMLYPRDFGGVTAGSGKTSHVGVSYESLRIQGYNYGAYGLSAEHGGNGASHVFPNVDVSTAFGASETTQAAMPIMTGALGSTFIAQKYWESFAIGAALVGIPIVIGENVVGVDRASEFANGRIQKAPELDRRIDTYLRYAGDEGAIIVQMNVEDTENGVAEYVAEHYSDRVVIELKWGQGAKDIGGEIQVNDLDYALFLRDRGYVLDPDPYRKEVQDAFRHGWITSFARHSRLGYTNRESAAEVREEFMEAVEKLRGLGFKRITLKTGAYGMEALAMAIRFASDAGLDLLTIDGAGGGTGMSPWNMMESWGVPSLHLHAKAREYADVLAGQGRRVVDMAFGGGLAREDHIFKALALGAPYAKMVCMGRALMIPGFLGANVEGVFHPERQEELNGNWSKLPKAVAGRGETPEHIFAGYYSVESIVGKEHMSEVPYGAVALWTLADKLKAGVQQFMAGARRFRLSEISRDDIVSGNRETERETGVPFMTEAFDHQAKEILKG
jgi:hypothetical protein